MSEEQLTQTIKQAISQAIPKEWLTKEDLCREFKISSTLLRELENDVTDPLIFTTMGSKKHLYHRPDINAFLERRKRNII